MHVCALKYTAYIYIVAYRIMYLQFQLALASAFDMLKLTHCKLQTSGTAHRLGHAAILR